MGLASGSILCDMLEPEAALAADLMRLWVRVYYILVLLLDLRWALTGLSHPYLYSLFFVVSNSKGPFHGSQGGNQFLKQLAGAGVCISYIHHSLCNKIVNNLADNWRQAKSW